MDSRNVQKYFNDEKIRVNEVYRGEQNNAVEKIQQKETENTNTNEDNVTSSTNHKRRNRELKERF